MYSFIHTIYMVNCLSFWDGTSYLPNVKEKLIAVLTFLGYSDDQSTDNEGLSLHPLRDNLPS